MPDDLEKRTMKELRELARSLFGEGVSRLKTRAQLVAELLRHRARHEAPSPASSPASRGAEGSAASAPSRATDDTPPETSASPSATIVSAPPASAPGLSKRASPATRTSDAQASASSLPPAGTTPAPLEGPPGVRTSRVATAAHLTAEAAGPRSSASGADADGHSTGMQSPGSGTVNEGFFVGQGRPRTSLAPRPQLRLFARDPWTLMALWEVSPALRPAGDSGEDLALELTVRVLDGREVLREPMPLSGSRYLHGLDPGTSYVAELWWSIAGQHVEPVAVVPRTATLPVGPDRARHLEQPPARFVRIPWGSPLGRQAIPDAGASTPGGSAALLASPGMAPFEAAATATGAPVPWTGSPGSGASTAALGSSWAGAPSRTGASWAGSPSGTGASWGGSPSRTGSSWAGSPSHGGSQHAGSPSAHAGTRMNPAAGWAGSPSPWSAAQGPVSPERSSASSVGAEVAWPWAPPTREADTHAGGNGGGSADLVGGALRSPPASGPGTPPGGRASQGPALQAGTQDSASGDRPVPDEAPRRSAHVVTHWAPVRAGFFLAPTTPRRRGRRNAASPTALAAPREGEPLAVGEHEGKR